MEVIVEKVDFQKGNDRDLRSEVLTKGENLKGKNEMVKYWTFESRLYWGARDINKKYRYKIQKNAFPCKAKEKDILKRSDHSFLQKLKIELSYDLEISLQGIYSKEWKAGSKEIFVHWGSQQPYSQ